MRKLSIDFETRSVVDLTVSGVYPYARHPSTAIWCMAWAFDEDEPQIWVPGELLPAQIAEHIAAGGTIHAWNAQFERVMWNDCAVRLYGFPRVPLEQWVCTAAAAAAMALPRALAQAAEVLGVAAQKDAAGHRLMLQMCRPRRMEEAGPVWWEDPSKIERLVQYCLQDVRTEVAVAQRLRPLGETERRVYLLDQRINDRGVRLDEELARAAKAAAEEELERQNAILVEATGGEVDSVTRLAQLRAWLASRGVETDSLDKVAVRDLLARGDLPPDVLSALSARAEAGRSSIAKIDAMLACLGTDGRMRGLLLYHGASTGRWSGRLVQPQNFPRPELDDAEIEAAIAATLAGEPQPLGVIASLLRSMMVPAEGAEFVAADYAAIEARVLAWVAGQDDLVELFRRGGDPYKEIASVIYGVPYDKVTKTQRQHGKVTILGCGYGMGWRKYRDTARDGYGVMLTEPDARLSVQLYRSRYARIPELWTELNAAVIHAVERPGEKIAVGRVGFLKKGGYLWAILPSGRPLAYAAPRVVPRDTPWGSTVSSVEYSGTNSYTRKWERMQLYGGLIAENIVQAISRDLLAAAALRAEEAGYIPVLSVHDELVTEVPLGTVEDAKGLERLMSVVPSWANGCPVAAEGWIGRRYRK